MFPKWIDINVCHFLIHLLRMTDYKSYPPILSAPSEAPPQVGYHLSVIKAKRRGLINKEAMFKKKYEKYTKILNQLTWFNACSCGMSVATGISSIATFVTFIEIPVSAALGAASMAGAIASGIMSALTKKYQQKLNPISPGRFNTFSTWGGNFAPPSVTLVSLVQYKQNFLWI